MISYIGHIVSIFYKNHLKKHDVYAIVLYIINIV